MHGSIDNNIVNNPQDIFGKETFAREGYKPGNQDPADRAAIERIASRLRGAKARCGPRAKPADRRHYRGVTFDFPSPAEGARQLHEKLGPIPEGMSLDRIDPSRGYSLENIRYATPRQQALNTRRAARFWR